MELRAYEDAWRDLRHVSRARVTATRTRRQDANAQTEWDWNGERHGRSFECDEHLDGHPST
eukprot:12577442-Alexandrium_andersonii.AAC.1